MSNKHLKDAGLKITFPRTKILEILKNTTTKHLSAEDIFKILNDNNNDISLATIYRVLTQFENTGIINKLNFENETSSVYEININKHHDHLICINCGNITEFNDPTIEKRQKEIAKKMNFNMLNHSLHIYGECKNCKTT